VPFPKNSVNFWSGEPTVEKHGGGLDALLDFLARGLDVGPALAGADDWLLRWFTHGVPWRKSGALGSCGWLN
jgi:hypothetical protein